MAATLQRTLASRRYWLIFLVSTVILTPTLAISLHASGFRAGATLQVDNTAPTVSIGVPSGGEKLLGENEALSVQWTVSEFDSGSGVDTVSLSIGGNDQGVSFSDYDSHETVSQEVVGPDGTTTTITVHKYTYSYSWNGWSDGSTYTIEATATDNAGNTGSHSVDVTTIKDVDCTKSWLHPSSGSWVSGTVDLVVKAYPTSDVGSVSFTVDGGTTGLVSTSTSSPVDTNYDDDTDAQEWTVQLDTTELTSGSHTVQASFSDAQGDSYTVGVIMGSEAEEGPAPWLTGIPATTWLVSFGIAMFSSLFIAYAVKRYILTSEGEKKAV